VGSSAVLRHLERFPVLVLEEPEAHLHPELQRVVAQVVVRLIRKGVCVWITTHSEIFCQQINNFIKLGSLPEEKEHAVTELERRLHAWMNDEVHLPGFVGAFAHVEIRLDEKGRGTYRA
jgi:predicted ATPase